MLDPPAPSVARLFDVTLIDANQKPLIGEKVLLVHNGATVDFGWTDEVGKVYLQVPSNIVDMNEGHIVFETEQPSDQKLFSILFSSDEYARPHLYQRTALNDGSILITQLGSNSPSNESFAASDRADTAKNNPTQVASPSPTLTLTSTPQPMLMLEKFDESSEPLWVDLGPVDSESNNRYLGNVEIEEGTLQFNLFMRDRYWVHHVDVPVEKPLKDVVIQADVSLLKLPQNEGVCRFHVQLRRQPNHNYYSVTMDHTNVVTIYFVSVGDDGVDYQKLHDFHLTGFKRGAGETNTLMIELHDNVFNIHVNGGSPHTYVDRFRLIEQPGDIKLGVDGPEDTMIEYRIDDLMIREVMGQ